MKRRTALMKQIFNKALNAFNLGQFKTGMKKMAAHLDFCFFPGAFCGAFLSSVQYSACNVADVCSIKVLFTLLGKKEPEETTYIEQGVW